MIKYFAHYQGGVHLQLSSRARKKEQDMVRRVERLQHGIMIGQKNPLYFELLSIGQALGKSEDLRRLENRIMAA